MAAATPKMSTADLIASILKESSAKQSQWATALSATNLSVHTTSKVQHANSVPHQNVAKATTSLSIDMSKQPAAAAATSSGAPRTVTTDSRPTSSSALGRSPKPNVAATTSISGTQEPIPHIVKGVAKSASSSETSPRIAAEKVTTLPTVKVPQALIAIEEGERVTLSGTRVSNSSTVVTGTGGNTFSPLVISQSTVAAEIPELIKTVGSIGNSSTSSGTTPSALASPTTATAPAIPATSTAEQRSPSLKNRSRKETIAMVPPDNLANTTSAVSNVPSTAAPSSAPLSATRARSYSGSNRPIPPLPLGAPTSGTKNRPSRSPSKLLQMYSAKRLQISAVAERGLALQHHNTESTKDGPTTVAADDPLSADSPTVLPPKWASDSDSERDFLKATSVLHLKRTANNNDKEQERAPGTSLTTNAAKDVANSNNQFLMDPIHAKPASSVYTDDSSSRRGKSEDPAGSQYGEPTSGGGTGGIPTNGTVKVSSDSGVFVIPKLPLMQTLQAPVPDIVISNGENSISNEFQVFGPPSPEANRPPADREGAEVVSADGSPEVTSPKREKITAKQRLKMIREEKEQRKAAKTGNDQTGNDDTFLFSNDRPLVPPLQQFTELDRQAHINHCLKTYRMDAVKLKNTLLQAFAGVSTSTLKRMAGETTETSSSSSSASSGTFESDSVHSVSTQQHQTSQKFSVRNRHEGSLATNQTSSTAAAADASSLLNATMLELKRVSAPDSLTQSLLEEHRQKKQTQLEKEEAEAKQAKAAADLAARPLSRKAFKEQKEIEKQIEQQTPQKRANVELSKVEQVTSGTRSRSNKKRGPSVTDPRIEDLSPIPRREISSSLARAEEVLQSSSDRHQSYLQLMATAIPAIKLVTPSSDGSVNGSLERMMSIPTERRAAKGAPREVVGREPTKREVAGAEVKAPLMARPVLTNSGVPPPCNGTSDATATPVAAPIDCDRPRPIMSRRAFKEEKERKQAEQLAEERKQKEAREAKVREEAQLLRERVLRKDFTTPPTRNSKSKFVNVDSVTPRSQLTVEVLSSEIVDRSPSVKATEKATAIHLWVQDAINSSQRKHTATYAAAVEFAAAAAAKVAKQPSPRRPRAQTTAARIDVNATHHSASPVRKLKSALELEASAPTIPVAEVQAIQIQQQPVHLPGPGDNKRYSVSIATLSQLSVASDVLSKQTSGAFRATPPPQPAHEVLGLREAQAAVHIETPNHNSALNVSRHSQTSSAMLGEAALMETEREPSPAMAMPSELILLTPETAERTQPEGEGRPYSTTHEESPSSPNHGEGNESLSSNNAANEELFKEAPEPEDGGTANASLLQYTTALSEGIFSPLTQSYTADPTVLSARHRYVDREQIPRTVTATSGEGQPRQVYSDPVVQHNKTFADTSIVSVPEPFSRSSPTSPIRSPPPQIETTTAKVPSMDEELAAGPPEPFVRSPDSKQSYGDFKSVNSTRQLPSARRNLHRTLEDAVVPPSLLQPLPLNINDDRKEDPRPSDDMLADDSIIKLAGEEALLASSAPSSPTRAPRPSFLRAAPPLEQLPESAAIIAPEAVQATTNFEPFERPPTRLLYEDSSTKLATEPILTAPSVLTQEAIADTPTRPLPPLHSSPTHIAPKTKRKGTPSRRRPASTSSHLTVPVSDDEDAPKVSDVDENGAYRVKILSRVDQGRSARAHGSPNRSTSNHSSNGASRSSKGTLGGITVLTAQTTAPSSSVVINPDGDSGATTMGSKVTTPPAATTNDGESALAPTMSSAAISELEELAAKRIAIRKSMQLTLELTRLGAQETAARADIKRQHDSDFRNLKADLHEAEDRVALKMSIKAARKQLL